MIAADELLLNDRYRVVAVREDGRAEVRDFYGPATLMIATLHGLPRVLEGRAARHVAEEKRLLSWLRHPGLWLPRDVFVEDSGIWSVARPPVGVAALESRATVDEIARWGVTLCEILDALQRGHVRVLELRALAPETLRVTPDRRLVLDGFGLDRNLRIAYLGSVDAWEAPAGERADVWLIGAFLTHMLAPHMSSLDPRARALRVLARRALDPLPSRRPATRYIVRRTLERIASLPAPAPPRPAADVRRAARVAGVMGLVLGLVLALGCLGQDPWLPHAVCGQWIRGPATAGAAPLSSPLGHHPCVAWSARLVRVVERRTWDARAREYRMERYERVLLDRTASIPFTVDGQPVQGAALVLTGPREEVDQVPPGLDDRLRPGEHVVAVHGYEMYIRAGDVVYVHGAFSSQAPADGPVIVHDGPWVSFVAEAVRGALPCLALAGLCGGGLLASAVWWKGRRRRDGQEAAHPPR